MRFHELRHTFATMALEHCMDVKTLAPLHAPSAVAVGAGGDFGIVLAVDDQTRGGILENIKYRFVRSLFVQLKTKKRLPVFVVER